MDVKHVDIGDDAVARVRVGPGEKLALLAGPCVIESVDSCVEQARAVKRMATEAGLPLVFKASFDKANRTSVTSRRGVGIDEGLEALRAIRTELGVPVVTDIHTPDQAGRVGEVVDILQIPAFLCRQTDLLVAAGRTGRCVNIKKGQFLAPELMAHAAAKVVSAAGETNARVLLTERGTSFGYGDLVVDMRALVTMRESGWPVVYDATHSVQKPGGRGDSSGGDRSMVSALARAAVAAGIDAVFVETHPRPAEAFSDAATQLPHEDLPAFLAQLVAVRACAGGPPVRPDGDT